MYIACTVSSASVRRLNFAAEAVSNIPGSQSCHEEERGSSEGKEGEACRRREEWKEGEKRAHDSQENSLSQIYFDDLESLKARNVYLCIRTLLFPKTCCFKFII